VFVRYIAPGASNKRVLIVSRLAVVLLGCWALYQAIYAESILEKMLWAYTIYWSRAYPGGAGRVLIPNASRPGAR
jgi:SSS family solute:Na+ symporter